MRLKGLWYAMRQKWFNEESLIRFVRRLRERWPNAEITRVEQHKTKQVLYIRLENGYVKVIVHYNGGVRAYGSPRGVALAVKNIASRVLGIGEP